jgi:hypothetical protein
MASRCGRAAAASDRTVGRRTVGSGLANILGFPSRIVAEQLPEDDSDGGGKYSRVFFPDPAQYRFDWALETSDSAHEGVRVG